MNRKWLALGLLAVSTAIGSAADPLQFTNITVKLFPTLTDRLNAVAYDGTNTFLAVGDKQAYVAGNFTPMQPWFVATNWAVNWITSNSSKRDSNLTAVAFGGKRFVASGDNNWVFFATNIFSPGGLNWPSNNAKVFNNNARAAGAAYNGANFVAVGMAPQIGYTNLPTGTNYWPLATNLNPSFAESFRAVTPYGTNGFAACGIFGVVRISTDGGINWQTNRGGVGQPDLLGIAYDGKNTLVCVGATNATLTRNGTILVSTNRGTNWQTATGFPNLATNSPLNAVAYTGSGFIAVGKGGQIFTSTNAIDWTKVAVNWINNPAASSTNSDVLDLYGVTFATSGYMHDVGEIVGTNGNVIITAPPPPTNNSLGNKWICVGVTDVVWVGATNTLPANTLQVTNVWGTNVVAVDWFDAPVGGTQITAGVFITNGMFSFTPPFITDNSDNHTNTYYAQARDLRTGFVNTNRTAMTLTNFMRPTASHVSASTICNGDSTVLQANLTGNGPWTVIWSDGFTNFTQTVGSASVFYLANPFTNWLTIPNSVFNPTNLFPNCPTNHQYWVSKLSDAYFPADDPINLNASGTNWIGDLACTNWVTVNPRPTAAVITTNTICNGDSQALNVKLTGIGPWLVTWTDGFTSYTQTVPVSSEGPCDNSLVTVGSLTIPAPGNPFNPTNVFLNARTNHSYWVTAVSDANCSAWAGDIFGVAQITVNPRPTATLVTTNTICNGDSQVLQANLTGFGPWTVYWTDGVSNYTQVVGVNAAGPYTDYLTIPNGVFNPTNVFPNLPTNHFYWVTTLVDSNCVANSGDITGTELVKVNPRPTASMVTSQTICNGQSDLVQLKASLTGIGPWTVAWSDGFIQTTNAPLGSGVVAVRGVTSLAVTNLFPNDPTNYVFTVTSVTNADSCMGNQPGDLTCTNTVTVNPRPTASLLSFNTSDCNEGPVYTLTNTLTGTGPWTVYWNDGSSQVATNVGPGPVTLERTVYPTNSFGANVASNNVYYVTNVVDANSCIGNQPDDITGVVTNTVNPRPTASLLSFSSTDCDESPVYTLTNTLTGTGPWTIYWNDGSSQIATNVGPGPVKLERTVYPKNSFGANVVSNNVYFVTNVVDAGGCTGDQAGDITGVVTNTVNPRPTASLLSLNVTNCNDGTPFTLTNTLTGIGPWIVYWNDGFKQTNVSVGSGPATLSRTVHPTNSFGVNVASNNVYFVTNVVNADTCAGNQPGDIGGTNILTINPRPTAVLASLHLTNCNDGTSFIMTNTLTGIGPWTVYWNDGSSQVATNVGAGPVTLERVVYPTNSFGANAASNNVYYVTNVLDAESCIGSQSGDIRGTNVLTINPRPTVVLKALNVTNCNDGTFFIMTNTLTGIGPWTIYWNDGSSQAATNVGAGPVTLKRTVHPTNSYAANVASNNVYYVTGVSNADTCVGNLDGDIAGTNILTINPRPTAIVSGSTNIFVSGTNSVTAVIQADLTGMAPWMVTWSDGFVQTTNASPAIRDFTTNLLNLSYTNYTLTNYHSHSIYVTNSNQGALQQSGGLHNGQWYLDIAGKYYFISTNVVGSSSVATKSFSFTVQTLSDANCSTSSTNDLTGIATVTLSPGPAANVVAAGPTNLCQGDVAVLQAVLSGTAPWTVDWSDGHQQIVSNNPAVYDLSTSNLIGATIYTITNLTDAVATAVASNLTGSVTITVYAVPTNLPVSFGGQTNCAGVANPPLVVADTNSVVWYDTNGIIVASDTNSFTPTDSAPGTWSYFAAEINTNGCAGPAVQVDLVLLACTNPPVIKWGGTNGVGTIEWFGNLTLQSATNLLPPVTWTPVVTNAPVGTNIWNWTNGVPPWTNPYNFFRLNTN